MFYFEATKFHKVWMNEFNLATRQIRAHNHGQCWLKLNGWSRVFGQDL